MELEIASAKAKGAEAHCTLSCLEIDSLRQQLHACDAGKNGKSRPQLNMDGRTLTLPEMRAEHTEHAAARKAKEEAELAKQQARMDQRNAREAERAFCVTSRVFSTGLGRITKKNDLKDVAACFGLSQEGTNVELTARIKAYMLSNPSLRENPRFAALFGKHGSKPSQENAESQIQNNEGMMREIKMKLITDGKEVADLEGDSFWSNIDPSLRNY
ncbi:hypothetical protein M422DRAFT_44635 [Sphaerobolus stellatus SS14]|nr:hypothetical protein M422DRAFT_44635 [Sphaerobolus stellatus SS14]